MHSVQTRLWDPQPPSKHVSPFPGPPPSNFRHTNVTSATPAKRITFYKSGDNQFGGVRMAIHKRSFKCFDTLLDDLSQKVPLPFGVRTVTTPRGTHTIKHLEQLQDGGCYLCSDRRHAKPINLELAGKRQGIWYHHGRRPQRPEAPSTTPPGHVHYRQRRILLVKNSEPGMRRSIVLNRKSTRSLRVFLEEVSEVMQFHVRKLYTAEGRRIDSVQSLITCPGVLVCVGREAFSPMLINFIRKTSEEKLPGLSSKSPGLGPRTPGNGARSPATQGIRSPPHGGQSRASEYDEGHESKKNVNFGLETKKSIIHPRSDSSNRSARFSLSSEKSCGVFSQARPAIMNDDIEKRVLVNKDGSLSVEMRVRFRLQSDESLQWSTQIKKSPSLTNESCPLSQTQQDYLQHGQSESCSDPDSGGYDCVDYNGRPLQCAMEENHCPCCYQRQDHQFDLWENPAHSLKHPPVPPPHPSNHTMTRHTHSSSSSSSCNSRRVVRRRARLSQSSGSGSEKSQLVQEEMCMTEQIERRVEVAEDGDTQVEVCKVSRCCSTTELVAMNANLRPHSGRSVEGEPMMGENENRPFSAISCSSHVLQSLKEDQDDEEDDLPPSASQCSHRDEPSPSQSPVACQDEKPMSKVSANSIRSTKPKESQGTGSRALSEASSCCCGAATPHSADRVPSSASNISNARIPKSEEEDAADVVDEEINRAVSGLSVHTGLSARSQKSGTSSVCPNCGGCKRAASSNSRASKRSNNRTSPRPASPPCNNENDEDDDGHDDKASDTSAGSTQSNKTNLTNRGRLSAMSNVLEGRAPSATSRASNPESKGREEEERATSAASHTSNKSHKSGCNGLSGVTADEEEKRSRSAMSAQSNLSAKSGKSHKSKCTSEVLVINPREEAEGENAVERAVSSLSDKSGASVKSHKSSCGKVASPLDKTAAEEDDAGQRAPSSLSVKSGKAESILSDRSNISGKSGTSRRSACSHCAKAASPVGKAEEEPANGLTERGDGAEIEERAASALSAKSNLSNKSSKSAKASERSPSPRSVARGDEEERATSQMSVKSVKSCKCNESEKVASLILKVEEDAEESERLESTMSAKLENEKRPASARSGKSASSAKSCHANLDGTMDRSPSATSGRSHTSAKSQKSNHPVASPNQDDTDAPVIETNGEEIENENQERPESARSTKSKSSGRSGASRKSNSSRNPSNPNVTIKTPEGTDEEGNKDGENNNSALKSKSGSFHDQTLSPKRTPSPRTHSPKTPAASPRSSPSPAQHLRPSSGAAQTRGPSALSVHSITSAKSGRSKCRCGAASALEKEDKEDKEDGKSEGAASLLSSSSKRQRKESEGMEKPLSRASSGSVSLGLPEDQDTADSDSGKSSVSFHKNTEVTQNASKNPKSSSGSSASQRSNGKSSKNASHNPIPTIEMPRGGENEEGGEEDAERATSAVTVKSSKSCKSCSNCSVKSATQTLESKERGSSPSPSKTGSVRSSSTTKTGKMDTVDNRNSSAMSGSAKVRSKSPASASIKDASPTKSCVSATSDNENQDISRPTSEAKDKEDIAQNKAASVYSQSPSCLRPESAASTQSKSKKASQQSKGNQDSVQSEGLSPVKSHKSNSASSQKKETPVKSSSPCSLHGSRPGSKVEASNESMLFHSLSAADLLKETIAAARQYSQQSKASKTSDKPRSEKSEKSDQSKRSRKGKDQEGEMELTPACLPNASPNEVVSNWLRSIPADTSLLALGNDLNEELEEHREKEMEDASGEEKTEEESPENERVDKDEKVGSGEEDEKEDKGKCDAAEEEKSSGPCVGDAAGLHLSKNWHSTAAVMKVLLSSSHGRCRSMPEVSPVYGRRLSTSARGLLDCLAQLQLIEPAAGSSSQEQKDRKQQYDEIMALLQSLWLTEPRDIVVKDTKDGGLEQVTPPRSSSGVGMSSGSGGSGKENGNQGGDETSPKGTELLQEEEVVAKVAEEDKGSAKAKDKETGTEPGDTSKAEEPKKSEEQSPQSPKATENPSSSDKSSTNNSSKSATDNERETLEGSPSDTPPNAPRATLSKRLSQDPDPVWVLNLLTKVEKQFMSHYINAMAEFKVRWDLDDSIILDTMITELRDEVSRRIQSSIQREMRKIQSRAGKGGKSPRPPQLANMSRESTTMEKRRRMLKVMKNQSVKTAESHSDEETAGEFSDQRSEDEYCPCDACVAKKMAARPLKNNPLAAEAPVMMEFDLLKILQLKKGPTPAHKKAHQPPEAKSEWMVVDEEQRNLEVLKEEEEYKTKEDIKADIVLEETIPEEDEEEEQEKDEDDVQEVEENGENSEEQEEDATTGEEAEQDETTENGEEDEGRCTCQSAREEDESNKEDEGEDAEETSGNTGDEGETGGNEEEAETGEQEEESDKETVKEASSGEVEEESEEDGAAENVADEESTLVEEVVEGNVSASAEAEDEDDENDGTGESHEDEKGEESEEQEGEASEEEKVSFQSQNVTPTVCVTEGEEADAEDSDDSKRQSDTGAEESGREETGASADEVEKESGEDGEEEEADEATVEEFKSEEDSKPNRNKKEEGKLLHQFTKSSVESQSGSMEEVDTDPSSNPVNSIELPKMADSVSTGGGMGHRRSRSPARIKRRKPKESDDELDDF